MKRRQAALGLGGAVISAAILLSTEGAWLSPEQASSSSSVESHPALPVRVQHGSSPHSTSFAVTRDFTAAPAPTPKILPKPGLPLRCLEHAGSIQLAELLPRAGAADRPPLLAAQLGPTPATVAHFPAPDELQRSATPDQATVADPTARSAPALSLPIEPTLVKVAPDEAVDELSVTPGAEPAPETVLPPEPASTEAPVLPPLSHPQQSEHLDTSEMLPAASEPVVTELALLQTERVGVEATPQALAGAAEHVVAPAPANADSYSDLVATFAPREPVLGLASPSARNARAAPVRPAALLAANENSGHPVRPRPDPVTTQQLFSDAGSAAFGQSVISFGGFTQDDELIFELSTQRREVDATIVGYTRDGIVYLPLGEIARLLDLAITVSDGGRYADGWAITPDRTVTLNLREGSLTIGGRKFGLAAGDALAEAGELYLRAEKFGDLLPLNLVPDLRSQSVTVVTREVFPFQQRIERETARDRLGSRRAARPRREWPREQIPWLALSVPMVDAEFRLASDSLRGLRGESDLRIAGDLAWLTARAYASSDTRDGLTSASLELGRRDPEGGLFGPLRATAFGIGDVSSAPLSLGLASTSGRGFYLGNTPLEQVSVFDTVDLRGELPDGYEVELYRNNLLIDSSRIAVNGQYQFLNVPVEFGLNVLRLVFYGPQGQRREVVRQINVGDGQLPRGQLLYVASAVQKNRSLFDVHPRDFFVGPDDGSWRLSTQLQYGISERITAVAAGAWYERFGRKHWLANTGLRTGLGGTAIKVDLGLADHAGRAVELGVARKIGGFSVTAVHAEYRGGYVDEVRSYSDQALRRATEISVNGTIRLGSSDSGFRIPVYGLARDVTFASGQRVQTASFNQSLPLARNIHAANLLEFNRTSLPGFAAASRLAGAFNLATLVRSKTQLRTSLGYELAPRARLTSIGVEVGRQIGDAGIVRVSASRSFVAAQSQAGISFSQHFRQFSIAAEGNYTSNPGRYSAVLRLGMSFGRDPLDGGFFLAPPGMASGGAVALRAFRDNNGDARFDPGDEPLTGVRFFSGTEAATTNGSGNAVLAKLGDGPRVSIQVDTDSLPDISLAPLVQGFGIAPRAGRIFAKEFPITALGELEGTAHFSGANGDKAVSGLLILLHDSAGSIAARTRTSADGTFWFEKLEPGSYTLTLDPIQAERLKIRIVDASPLVIGNDGTAQRASVIVSQP